VTADALRAIVDAATETWELDRAYWRVFIGGVPKGCESEADARLIALAPDLARFALDAREALRPYAIDQHEHRNSDTCLICQAHALLARLDEIEKGLPSQ
jgi:hypothetical protein